MADPRRANPIPISRARVVERTAKRLGYSYVAVCETCQGKLISLNEEARESRPIWRHPSNDMSEWCPPRQLVATRVS